MTLVLTAASPLYVVQVSDRLLTKAAPGEKYAPFDPVANKTVVYRATDGLVTIGYSGIAYIGETPTDEWLAEVLWGEPLHRGADGIRPAIAFQRRAVDWDIGLAAIKLQEAINNIPAGKMLGHGLFLTIGGWQISHRHLRPVIIELTRAAKSVTTTLERAARTAQKGRDFLLAHIGAHITNPTLRAYLTAHKAEHGSRLTIEDAEKIMAQIIRDTAGHQPTVGSHLMSVLLPKPGMGQPLCRFIESAPHFARLVSKTTDVTMPTAFCPWLIGPGVLYPPSMVVGETTIGLGGIDFVIHGAAAKTSITGLSSSVRRPRLPRR